MSDSLPNQLQLPADPEEREDFRNLLEEIVQQNAEILRRLRDWDDEDDDEVNGPSEPKSTIIQLFNAVFSFWGLCILIVICSASVQIFTN